MVSILHGWNKLLSMLWISKLLETNMLNKHVRNDLTVANPSLEKVSVSHKLLGSVPIRRVHRDTDT